MRLTGWSLPRARQMAPLPPQRSRRGRLVTAATGCAGEEAAAAASALAPTPVGVHAQLRRRRRPAASALTPGPGGVGARPSRRCRPAESELAPAPVGVGASPLWRWRPAALALAHLQHLQSLEPTILNQRHSQQLLKKKN